MILEPKSRLVMIGDSITDCGRSHPVGEGDGLGSGYVHLVDALLAANYPELQVRILNVGSSGHRTRELRDRWQRDVLDLTPDYVSIMIGTNDVWRQFDRPTRPEEGVPIDEYRTILRDLVAQTKPRVKKVILMTPFFLEPLTEEAMRKRMDEYSQVVRELAFETESIFVDTQSAFAPILATVHSSAIGWDRVHPSLSGHMIIAKAFLDSLGFSWR